MVKRKSMPSRNIRVTCNQVVAGSIPAPGGLEKQNTSTWFQSETGLFLLLAKFLLYKISKYFINVFGITYD